ncbi:MAG: hypothetical protein ABI999_00135 [Acidobacteriota bacterium]
MKRLALTLVLTSLCSLVVAADDGQIPIGGKSGTCNPGVQCHSITAPDPTADTQETSDTTITSIGGSTIIEALRTMGLM